MSAHASLAQNEPCEAQETAIASPALTRCLDEKLAELRAKRCKPLWIECSKADLVTLVCEGDDDSVVLHPDPAVDRAWYLGVEIRCSPDRDRTWIFLKGEIEEDADAVSAHIVATGSSEDASTTH